MATLAILLMFGVTTVAVAGQSALFEVPGEAIYIDRFERSQLASSRLFKAEMNPFIIRVGMESFTLEIGVIDPTVDSLALNVNIWYHNGVETSPLILHDNGTHGDDIGGDGVFTIDSLTRHPGSFPVTTITCTRAGAFSITYFYAGGGSATFTDTLSLTFGYINPANVPMQPVTDFAPDVRGTDHAVWIEQPPVGAFPSFGVDNVEASRRYYEVFPDDRDFLFFSWPYNAAQWLGWGGYFGTVNNEVEGIGIGLFDNSSTWGSRGILQGISAIHSAFVNSFTLLTHELNHRWCAFLDQSLNLSHGHWDEIARPSSAFGPGDYSGVFASISSDTGGLFRACHNTQPSMYVSNDLERYLMGLVPLAQVSSPITTLVNPSPVDYWSDGTGEFCVIYAAEGIRNVSTAEILSTMGARMPIYTESQTSFESANIIIYPRPLTDVELAFFDFAMREYEKAGSEFGSHYPTFSEAHGGLATLSTSFEPRDLEKASAIISAPTTAIDSCFTYVYDVEATGTPAPVFALIEGPASSEPMTIDAETGLIEWFALEGGAHQIAIEAWNPHGADTQTYTLVVADADGDAVANGCDNCESVYNPAQEDADSDSIGDACEDQAPGIFSGDLTLSPDTSIAWSIQLSNEVFVQEIILPVQITNVFEVAFLDSISFVGTRCSYFESKQLLLDDRFNGRMAYRLRANAGNGSPPLDAGEGVIAKVYMRVRPSAVSGDSLAMSHGPVGGWALTIAGPTLGFNASSETSVATIEVNCTCPHMSDVNGDLLIDAVDLAFVIDIVFFGAPDVQDSPCPSTRADFNSDGQADAVDLALLIDHVFFGGTGPADPCSL